MVYEGSWRIRERAFVTGLGDPVDLLKIEEIPLVHEANLLDECPSDKHGCSNHIVHTLLNPLTCGQYLTTKPRPQVADPRCPAVVSRTTESLNNPWIRIVQER